MSRPEDDPGSAARTGSRRVLGFAASFGAVGVIGNLAQLAYTAVSARAIGPDGYAPYAAALLALALMSVATSAGTTMAILRSSVWDRERERGYLTFITLVGLVCALAMVGLSYVWDGISGVAGSGSVVRLAAPLALLAPLGLVGSALIRREGRGQRAAAIEMTAQLAGLAVGAVLVVTLRTPQSLLGSLVVSVLVTLVLAWASLGRLPAPGPLRPAGEQIRFTLGMTPLGLSAYALTSLPAYWAARSLLPGSFALFSRANLLVSIPALQVSGAVAKAAAPEFRELPPSRLRSAVSDLLVLGWASSALLLGLLAAVAEPVVALLLGPEWAGAALWVSLACIGWALSVPENLLSLLTEFQGRRRAIWLAQGLALVAMLASIAVVSRTPVAEYTPVVALAVLFGSLLLAFAVLQRDQVGGALSALAGHLAIAVGAFLLVRAAVALGGSWAGLAGQVTAAVASGAVVAGVVVAGARRTPAGRVLLRRGLLPAWVPGAPAPLTPSGGR